MSVITVSKVLTPRDREDALHVIGQVFVKEKHWMTDVHDQISEHPADAPRFSWFLARVNDRPAGVLRLLYDPSLELPEAFQVKLAPGVAIETLQAAGRYVEIGRFMILPDYRKNYRVALRLMRAASAEVIERDYTHFITDVFEGERHSPLNFHTRVLGFEVIGSHVFGDLNCSSTRIILTLDILKLYNRIKGSKNRIYRELAEGMRAMIERKYGRFKPQGLNG
jgi:hypothetical protein